MRQFLTFLERFFIRTFFLLTFVPPSSFAALRSFTPPLPESFKLEFWGLCSAVSGFFLVFGKSLLLAELRSFPTTPTSRSFSFSFGALSFAVRVLGSAVSLRLLDEIRHLFNTASLSRDGRSFWSLVLLAMLLPLDESFSFGIVASLGKFEVRFLGAIGLCLVFSDSLLLLLVEVLTTLTLAAGATFRGLGCFLLSLLSSESLLSESVELLLVELFRSAFFLPWWPLFAVLMGLLMLFRTVAIVNRKPFVWVLVTENSGLADRDVDSWELEELSLSELSLCEHDSCDALASEFWKKST